MHSLRFVATLSFLAACATTAVVDGVKDPNGDDTGAGDTGDSAAPSNIGDYVGTVDGLYSPFQGQQATCAGEATFTLAEDHTFAGNADCVSDVWGTLDGPLEGSIAAGVITGTWTVTFQPDLVPQDLAGTLASGAFSATTDYENTYGAFSSTLTLQLQ